MISWVEFYGDSDHPGSESIQVHWNCIPEPNCKINIPQHLLQRFFQLIHKYIVNYLGLTIDERLICVDNEFAENDCVIALYHVNRRNDGDWLTANPDLPCYVNDEETTGTILLSQGYKKLSWGINSLSWYSLSHNYTNLTPCSTPIATCKHQFAGTVIHIGDKFIRYQLSRSTITAPPKPTRRLRQPSSDSDHSLQASLSLPWIRFWNMTNACD